MCCNSYITYVSPGNWRGVNFQLKLTEVQLKKKEGTLPVQSVWERECTC